MEETGSYNTIIAEFAQLVTGDAPMHTAVDDLSTRELARMVLRGVATRLRFIHDLNTAIGMLDITKTVRWSESTELKIMLNTAHPLIVLSSKASSRSVAEVHCFAVTMDGFRYAGMLDGGALVAMERTLRDEDELEELTIQAAIDTLSNLRVMLDILNTLSAIGDDMDRRVPSFLALVGHQLKECAEAMATDDYRRIELGYRILLTRARMDAIIKLMDADAASLWTEAIGTAE